MAKKQPFIWTALSAFRWVILRVSQKTAVKIGSALGGLVHLFSKKRTEEAAQRCSERLGISMDEARDVVKVSYRHFGAATAEFARMPEIARDINKYITVVGEENLRRVYEKNKGVIFATAHMGNWEYAACWCAQNGYKMAGLGAEQRDERITDLIAELRSESGVKAFGKKADLRTVIKALREGYIIGIPVDQDAKEHGILSDFLGKPASTPLGIAKFAVKTGCAVIPSFCTRNPDGVTYTFTILPALEGHDGKPYGEDIQQSLDDCNSVISEWIRKTPEQWLWMYPRWQSYDRGIF